MDTIPRRPIRVAFVVHAMQVAGVEVLVRETIRRLGPRIVPTVLCLDRVGQIGDELLGEGIDLHCFERKPGRDFGVSRRIAAAVSDRKIDVIHAHQYTPFFYSALAKPFCRPVTKLILTEHGRHFPDVVSPLRRAFNRTVLDRLADAVNACCRFSANALSRVDGFRGNRIRVIENGIPLEPYGPSVDKSELKRTLGLEPIRRYVVHIARHHPVKDQSTLIRGFASATTTLLDVDLVLVGDGPLREELEDLVRSLGVADRVRFVGIQNNVPEWLRAADAFALTSVSEAASLTLLEAMAAGLPVVVTNVGGNPEIVRQEVEGLLVPRGDAPALAEAFGQIFCDPDLAQRLGNAGRRRVNETYRLDRTVDSYFQLYRTLTRL
ncbi:MAG TPA: glycosyltransferase [Fimbriiglobus sp.]|jgi:glycosyltransferase involved in cell wall biosynthesis